MESPDLRRSSVEAMIRDHLEKEKSRDLDLDHQFGERNLGVEAAPDIGTETVRLLHGEADR